MPGLRRLLGRSKMRPLSQPVREGLTLRKPAGSLGWHKLPGMSKGILLPARPVGGLAAQESRVLQKAALVCYRIGQDKAGAERPGEECMERSPSCWALTPRGTLDAWRMHCQFPVSHR